LQLACYIALLPPCEELYYTDVRDTFFSFYSIQMFGFALFEGLQFASYLSTMYYFVSRIQSLHLGVEAVPNVSILAVMYGLMH